MKGKKVRYNVRLGFREGVAVAETEDFEWAFETFYGWMEALAERKEGFDITRSREYLHDVMRTMHSAGQGHFFFANHEGQPLSGAYVFTFGNKFWFMYGAAPHKRHELQPNYALQWGMMRWARQHGITYYDMVGIPKRQDRNENDPYYGVYRFKTRFGGEEVDFLGCYDLSLKPAHAAAWYRLDPLYYRLYQRLKHNVFY
jgi:lipid II:glycine glycyltransferase (peptidoglycan interpeptide bridge formation enzyme)